MTEQEVRPEVNPETQTPPNEFRGYSLFNDIEDAALRLRNRAITLCNIAELYTDKKTNITSGAGGLTLLGYFASFKPEERQDIVDEYHKRMLERGFKLVAKK